MSGAIQKQTRKHGVSTSSRKQPTRSENTDLKISQLSTSQATETSTLLKDRNFNKELRKGGSCGTATNVSIRNCNDEELSRELILGLRLEEETNTDKATYIAETNRNSGLSDNTTLSIDHDVVDWSDEGEEDDDTPRNHDLLSRLAEESEDDGDDVLQFSRRTTNSHSGRWSSFSWSSLYERAGTDSSLSWAEDELEKETTERVKSLFDQIDRVLYADEGVGEKELRVLEGTSGLTEEILDECELWRGKFPHLRIVGKSIPKPLEDQFLVNDCEIKGENSFPPVINQYVPKDHLPNEEYNNVTENRGDISMYEPTKEASGKGIKSRRSLPKAPLTSRSTSALSSAVSTISTITLTENDKHLSDTPEELDEEFGEVTYASHGTYVEGDQDGIFKGEPVAVMATNSRFKENPSQYLKDKLMEAVFRKIWSTVVAKNIQTLVDAAWSNEQQAVISKNTLEKTWSVVSDTAGGGNDYKRWTRHGTGISSIDENSIFNGIDQRQNNNYGKLSSDNYPIRPTLHPEFHHGQTDNSSSLDYLTTNTTQTPNYSPPFSDLNPISLPHLGASLPTRPMVASAPPVRQRLISRQQVGTQATNIRKKIINRQPSTNTNTVGNKMSFRSATAVPTISGQNVSTTTSLTQNEARSRNSHLMHSRDISNENSNSRLVQKRTRPTTIGRMRSKSGSPPPVGNRHKLVLEDEMMSPSATPIIPVLPGGFNLDHPISLPPITNNGPLSSNSKGSSHMSLLRPPSNRQSSSNSSLRNSASSDLGVGSSVSVYSSARPGTRSSLSSGKFSRSSSSNALSTSSQLEAKTTSTSRIGKLSTPFINKRNNSLNRSPRLQSVTFDDTSPTKIPEGTIQQFQSLPRGISISGKRLKKLPANSRRKVLSPDRMQSYPYYDGMAATVNTYTQSSPERSMPKPLYRTVSNTFEKLPGGKISPVLNGASSPTHNYQERDSKHRLPSPTMQKLPRWRN